MTPLSKEAVQKKIKALSVVSESGCWEWSLYSYNGYGRVTHEGRRIRAHRAAYEAFVGPIPDGFQIDHLCRNRGCVNPDHLEPVTQQENIRRGESITNKNLLKDVCNRGHKYDQTYKRKDRLKPYRKCGECSKIWNDARPSIAKIKGEG